MSDQQQQQFDQRQQHRRERTMTESGTQFSPPTLKSNGAAVASGPKTPSKRIQKFLQEPIKQTNSILREHHRSMSQQQKQSTLKQSASEQRIDKSPLRNVQIIEKLAQLTKQIPSEIQIKNKLHSSKSAVGILSPKFAGTSSIRSLNNDTTQGDTSTKKTSNKDSSFPVIRSGLQLKFSQKDDRGGGKLGNHAKHEQSWPKLLETSIDVSRSQMFNLQADSTNHKSMVISRKGSFSELNQPWTPKLDDNKYDSNRLEEGFQRDPKYNDHINTKDLLVADQHHEKSLKLLAFLEQRTEKRSRSMQQRVMDAMDRSIKKGPLKMPQKLLRKLHKEEKKAKQIKAQKREVENESGSAAAAATVTELTEDKSSAVPSEQVLPMFKERKDLSMMHQSKRRAVSKDGVVKASKAEQQFELFIPDILENSINLKLRADYNERKAEYAEMLRSNKIKAKQRASLAVAKLLSAGTTSLEEVCPRQQRQGAASMAQDSSVIMANDIHIKTTQLCHAYKGAKQFEVGQRDQKVSQVAIVNQRVALQQIKRRLERQRSILKDKAQFSQGDQEAFDQAIASEINGDVAPEDLTQVKECLQAVLNERFVSQSTGKVEQKTLKLLLNEVIKQVRTWSSGHADLIVQLVARKDTLASQNAKQIKQTAHLVKDKLAKTVAKLQSKLQQIESVLSTKMKTLSLGLRAQEQLETNFDAAMQMYHAGYARRTEAEQKLKDLQNRVASWLPNFVRYDDKDRFKDGLRFVRQDLIVDDEMKADMWNVVKENTSLDPIKDMWGFSQCETPHTVLYLGESLESKYKREELWLRSDVTRLQQLFNVATPTSVALEQAQFEIQQLKYERDSQAKVITNINMELKVRYGLLTQLKSKELKNNSELERMEQLEQVLATFQKQKTDTASQTDLLNDSITNLQIEETKKQSPIKLSKKQKQIKNLLRKGAVGIDLDVPSLKKNASDQYSRVRNRLRQNFRAIDPQNATERLTKMIDLDLFNIAESTTLKNFDVMRHSKLQGKPMQFIQYYQVLRTFFDHVVKQFPFCDESAYGIYVSILADNNSDLVQSLNDLEQLSHEDWRFAIMARLVGVRFDKDKYSPAVQSALIDNRESTSLNFVAALLDDLSSQIEVLRFFSSALMEGGEDYCVDADLVLASITHCGYETIKEFKGIKRVSMPQMLLLAYKKLQKSVGKVECYVQDTTTYSRHLFSRVYDDINDMERVEEIKFFVKLLFAVHYQGQGSLKNRSDDDHVTNNEFIGFLREDLHLAVPDWLADDRVSKFLTRQILSLRKKPESKNQSPMLRVADLKLLSFTYVRQFLTLKDSMMIAMRAGQHFNAFKLSIFEPIFNYFRGKETFLTLTGSFYQSLLFISKTDVSNSFADTVVQQKAFVSINKRTRQLIGNLRDQKVFKSIGLAKFADACSDLGLASQLGGALRKLSRQDLLLENGKYNRIKECLEKLDLKNPDTNQSLHGEIAHIFSRADVQVEMHATEQRTKFPPPTKYCGIIAASHYSPQQVFNLFDPDKMRPSFNVYMDVGLGELEMTVQASKQYLKQEKKKRNRSKARQQLQQKAREISIIEEGSVNITSDIYEPKVGVEIAIQTEKRQQQDDEFQPWSDSKQPLLQTTKNFVGQDELSNAAKQTSSLRGVMAYDQSVNIFENGHLTITSLLTTKNYSKNIDIEDQDKQEVQRSQEERESHDESIEGEDSQDESQEDEENNDLAYAMRKNTHRTTIREERTQFESDTHHEEQPVKQVEPLKLINRDLFMASEEAKIPLKPDNPDQTQNTWVMRQTTYSGSPLRRTQYRVHNALLHMRDPIVEVKSRRVGQAPANVHLVSSPETRTKPLDFVMNTEVITGENKWRGEVQKHKDRITEARSTQFAKFSSLTLNGGSGNQSRATGVVSKDRIVRKLNSDLALIDHRSDFSGSFANYPKERRTDGSVSYSPENRRFAGKTCVNQINMNGDERRFSIKTSLQQQLAPKTKPQGKKDDLTNKVSNTLKLLKSFKESKSPSQAAPAGSSKLNFSTSIDLQNQRVSQGGKLSLKEGTDMEDNNSSLEMDSSPIGTKKGDSSTQQQKERPMLEIKKVQLEMREQKPKKSVPRPQTSHSIQTLVARFDEEISLLGIGAAQESEKQLQNE